MAEDEGRIQEILAGLQAPEQKPGLARQLLSAIPQAISVLFSEKPAEMLQLQLNQKQEKEEREKEKKQRINQLGAQLQIEDILTRAKERRTEDATIRAEDRAEDRAESAESRADFRDLARFNRESGFQEKLVNLNFEKNKELSVINQIHRLQEATVNIEGQKEVERLRSSNNITEQRIGGELNFIRPLVYSGFYTGKSASDLYDKIQRGEKLSSGEEKEIRKAYDKMRDEDFRQKLALTNASKEGRTNILQKGTEWAMTRASTNDLGLDANSQIQELHKDMLGNLVLPDGTASKKILNEDEQFRYYYNYWARTQGAPVDPNMANDIPDEKAVSLSIDQAIQEARNERRSDSEISQRLNDPNVQAKLRATPQQVQEGMSRNKVSGQTPSAPVSPEGTADDILLSLERGGNSEAIEAAQKDVAAKGAKFQAAKTVNYLITQLRLAKDSDRNRPTTFMKNTIKDLEKRLEFAYSQHPELRPK